MHVSNTVVLFVPFPVVDDFTIPHARRCGSPGATNTGCVGREARRSQTKAVSYAPLWLLNLLTGEQSPSTYSETQQNTRGPELRRCVQSSGLTAGTVRWHLYYFTWGVLEDCTSICFPSLLSLQYRSEPTSTIWQRRTGFGEIIYCSEFDGSFVPQR